ncbi:FmdB family zinc ribbon protein [Megalodesulfovibrio paquesii]
MPIYEYRCQDCEQIFEEWQKDFQEREVPCPVCGAKAERLISSTSFILKGSGWYVTDYCKRPGSSAPAPAAEASGAGNGAANGTGNGESKPAAPAPAAASPAPAAASASAAAD